MPNGLKVAVANFEADLIAANVAVIVTLKAQENVVDDVVVSADLFGLKGQAAWSCRDLVERRDRLILQGISVVGCGVNAVVVLNADDCKRAITAISNRNAPELLMGNS